MIGAEHIPRPRLRDKRSPSLTFWYFLDFCSLDFYFLDVPAAMRDMTLPNWITASRLLGAPLLLITLHTPTEFLGWISLGIFLVCAGTDWLDGYLARRLNQISELGKFLDPLVDKLLVLAPLLALVDRGQVPGWGVFLIVAREITIAGWRVNQSQISGANQWGKLKTVTQIGAIALLIAPISSQWIGSLVAFWIAVGVTWISGGIYLRQGLRRSRSPQAEDPMG